MIRSVLVSLIAILLPTAVFAQVGASQGVSAAKANAPQGQTEFESPMVLTAPFPLTDRSNWSEAFWSDEKDLAFHEYRCDGIAIHDMQMRAIAQENGVVEIDVRGHFDSLKGHDKRVDMKFEFLNADSVVATGYSDALKAPEAKTKRFGFKFTIPAVAIQSDPPTRMRITLTDSDD
jgi:hypothetical protein